MFLVETRLLSVEVEDLGFTVRRDEPVWVTPDQERSSLCLKRLRQLGHVRVVPKQPSRSERPVTHKKRPPKPWRLSGIPVPPKNSAPPPKPQPSAATPVREAPRSLSRKEVERIATLAAREAAQEVLSRVEPSAPSPTIEEIKGIVEEVVGRTLEVRVAPSTTLGPQREELKGIEEPQFIPKDIVKSKDAPVLLETTKSSSSTGVSDAAKALKKARGGRRKSKETS